MNESKIILVINGHPDKESLCYDLAMRYKMGADKVGATCRVIHLADLTFSLNLAYGYRKRTELEPDLQSAQADLLNADHLVFVYPQTSNTIAD